MFVRIRSFYASQHEYPNFSDQLQRLKIGKLNKESIRHNVNEGSMTNLINYFHAVISVHDFETFIDLNRFVVLLPHCRPRDGNQGSSWSYLRWHEFFTSKKKKDRLSCEYHVVYNGRLAYRAHKVYYPNLTPFNNMNGQRVGFQGHQLQQLFGHDVIIPIFTWLLRQY